MLSAVTIQPEFTRFIGFWSTSHSEKQPCSCLEPWRGKAGLSLAADPSAPPSPNAAKLQLILWRMIMPCATAHADFVFASLCISKLGRTAGSYGEAVMDFATGNSDAQHLRRHVAGGKQLCFTAGELREWKAPMKAF